MYSENSYKNYIFWLKFKQIFLMIVFSIVGCVVGRFIGQYLVEVLLFPATSLYISVTVGTLFMFSIAAGMTSGTARDVQDAYWKIAVLRKLTVISKKLDNIPNGTKKEIKNIVKEKNIKSMKNDVEMDTMEEVEVEVEGIVDDMIGE